MNWDTEIWAPCRLGEAFTLREFRSEHTEYLYAIKADWMGHHGDAMCVHSPDQLTTANPYNVRVGAGPRPWANCWTYEAKIKITPPVWCWDMQDDTMFGLDLKPKRNGNRRKVKLDCVKIHEGRPVYRMIVETADGPQHQLFDSIPVLDPYFAPIWSATAEETPEVAEPEPVADLVAETVIETPETVTNGQPRRVLTTSNAADLAAAFMAQADEDAPASWTDTENRPPGCAWYYYYTWYNEMSEEATEWEDVNTVWTEESELVEGDAIYLRFAGCSRQIRRFEAYTGPHDFVSRIARFVDGTGMSLEKGHYYRKVI